MRGAAPGGRCQDPLYDGTTCGVSDVQAVNSLAGLYVVPMRKELVADFGTLGLSTVGNSEGMTWGDVLPSGERVLILVSGDNFDKDGVTQIVASPSAEPSVGNPPMHSRGAHPSARIRQERRAIALAPRGACLGLAVVAVAEMSRTVAAAARAATRAGTAAEPLPRGQERGGTGAFTGLGGLAGLSCVSAEPE
ncbi:esterase-like activity of phytase family protein [Streptomyces chartreusis]|uniref:esterase-like activity of phytase family protein n=1 Tax=Streptomyces chartreusis TaxID=1969 RepID=UPI002E1868C4